MRAAVFINYVGGVHQNDGEQQRQILSHTSRLKKSRRHAGQQGRSAAARPSHAPHCRGGVPNCDHFCPCNFLAYLETTKMSPRPGLANDAKVNGFGFDPFDALPVGKVRGVHQIAEYILQSYAAKIQPLQRALGCEPQTTKSMFTTAVANPEFFNAVMAHACADLEVQQTKVVAKTPSPKVLFFQGESFKALSRKLSKGGGAVDVSAVLAVLMLMGMNIAYGDAQPMLMHRRALRTMMELPAPPRTNKPIHWLYHDQLVEFTADFLSDELPAWHLAPGETLLTPYPPPRRRPLRYHSPHSLEASEASRCVPEGFRNLILQCHLSIETQEVIKRMSRIVAIFGNARNHAIETSDAGLVTAYKAEHEFHACVDCLRRIERAGMDDRRPWTGELGTTIEHVVCLALVAFINCVFACMTYGPLFKDVRDSLEIAIRDCEVLPGHGDCISWARCVGLWATSLYPGSHGPPHTDVTRKLRDGCTSGSPEVELHSMLQRFLWTEEMLASCKKALVLAASMDAQASS